MFAAAAACSRLAGHRAAGRIGDLTLLRGGALVGAVGTLIAAPAGDSTIAPAGVLIEAAGISVYAPILFSLAGPGADDAVRAAAVSVVTTIAYLGFLAGPAAVGSWPRPRRSRRASPRWPRVALALAALAGRAAA